MFGSMVQQAAGQPVQPTKAPQVQVAKPAPAKQGTTDLLDF